jgi:hypothetical protein
MSVSGQLHASACLTLGKEFPVPFEYWTGLVPRLDQTRCREELSLPLPRIEPRFPGRQPHTQVIMLMGLFRLIGYVNWVMGGSREQATVTFCDHGTLEVE